MAALVIGSSGGGRWENDGDYTREMLVAVNVMMVNKQW